MTQILKSIEDLREFRRASKGAMGFVPTMGALHEGHLSLLRRAKSENERSVLSIFVNPTQFNDPRDFEQYPQAIESDLQKLKGEGVDAVYLPEQLDLYPDSYAYRVEENRLSKELCGAFRPGHFAGMLTVVLKLLNLVQAERAYFGEKDYQQYLLIKGMAQAFFLSTEIVACPIVREASGLAMSSRNERLSVDARLKAALLYRALSHAKDLNEAKTWLTDSGFSVEYLEEKLGRRFVAASLEGVRLIDNVEI